MERRKVIIHKTEKSVIGIVSDIMNLFIISASVYYTYRRIFTPFVQLARVDWQCYTAEVMINGREYYLKSIDDEVPLNMGYVLKFDTDYFYDDQEYVRLIIENSKGECFECIQKNKVLSK